MVNSTTIHSFPVKVDFEVGISSHFGGSAGRIKQFPLPPTYALQMKASRGPKKTKTVSKSRMAIIILIMIMMFLWMIRSPSRHSYYEMTVPPLSSTLDVLFIMEDNLVTLQQLT